MDPATINVLLATGFGLAWLISCAAHMAKGERKRRVRIVPTVANVALISAMLGFTHQNLGLQTLCQDAKGKVVILEKQAEQLMQTVAKLNAEDAATTKPANDPTTGEKAVEKPAAATPPSKPPTGEKVAATPGG